MRLRDLTIVALALLLNYRSPVANDRDPSIAAEMTVYLCIVKVETTIKTCGRADPGNSTSYDKVYAKYHDEISGAVVKIGFLIGQEARLKGIDKETLFNFVERRVGAIGQEIERVAGLDSTRFMDLCHNLPKAAAAKIGPFEPLVRRFPQEMDIIQRPGHPEKLR